MRCFAALLAALCCLLAASSALSERVNRALLVGCDEFVTQSSMAPASAQNVTRMAEAIGSGSMNLETLVTRRGDLFSVAELGELIDEAFAGADEDDVSYFYISTHGVWDPAEPCARMAFLLSDGEREEQLTAADLRSLLDPVPGTKVLILDACHSGAVIGKGVESDFGNSFTGGEYKVICSSGGAEESWFWASPQGSVGAGYFSAILTAGVSAAGAYAADGNGDGAITLSELKAFLRRSHGASTPQVYPEEDAFVLFFYDPEALTGPAGNAPITGFSLDDNLLAGGFPQVTFSFTALRQLHLAYQLVFFEAQGWDFEHAIIQYDNAPGEPGYGIVAPGEKLRALRLSRDEEENGGYALLQLYALNGDEPQLLVSPVLCVPPLTGDPQLSVQTASAFAPASGEELAVIVRHAQPCSLTVRIEDEAGNLVCRLASRQATRPERLAGGGSFLCWGGLQTDGTPAAPGRYRVRATAYVGDERYEALSDWFVLAGEAEGDLS